MLLHVCTRGGRDDGSELDHLCSMFAVTPAGVIPRQAFVQRVTDAAAEEREHGLRWLRNQLYEHRQVQAISCMSTDRLLIASLSLSLLLIVRQLPLLPATPRYSPLLVSPSAASLGAAPGWRQCSQSQACTALCDSCCARRGLGAYPY